ncbi:hypothetical protein A2154_04265 [Candidatus Gottesmanbacteria bacterium RBG_16_43_7]|uniref:Uncharacterized protein n=1 Tax=Candidatus Gottesmanbacteria bacterium RBG_16_43_7 TaxID=1798373 RepID=A0A1F5Z8Y3_9BACT|nr:MAG: hypothetical protein A2154_04265 [Candidatus Gottesmanbacteria bacterium RBG_16_43_7]
MHRSIASVKGLGFILWHSRHEFYHVLLGLVWAWFLREYWQVFNPRWIWISVIGSLLPDLDHLWFFTTYGRQASYTRQIIDFLRSRQWRNLAVFIETGHKYNTSLSWHNYYFIAIMFSLAIASSFIEWESGVVLFGAILIHYIFDILDDLVQLGTVNQNWHRWGREKKL